MKWLLILNIVDAYTEVEEIVPDVFWKFVSIEAI
jgi:hypothetical protein